VNRALLAVTLGGLKTAGKIRDGLGGGHLFTLEKYCSGQEHGLQPITGKLRDFMGEMFEKYREIILVMSTGIAVRSIAPYVQSKLTDPAVVVLDEQGRFVISLLSGHIGGANALAEQVAKITGGQAVITTASDCLGLESVDMLAQRNHLIMESVEQVKKVTACLVNRKRVVLVNETNLRLQEDASESNMNSWEEISLKEALVLFKKANPPEAMIYVGYREEPGVNGLSIPVAKLRPKSLILGVGCKKNTAPERLRAAVARFFQQINITPLSLKAIATVDVKKDEPAILSLAEEMSLPLVIVGREEILSIENNFTCSDFVKKTIGVGCVAEPAAFIASRGGSKIAPKTAFQGITFALYEEKN